MRYVLYLILSSLFLLPPNAIAGTRVLLHDGRQFDGEVIEESPGEITIRVVISGITAELTFRRSEIRRMESIELESEVAEDPKNDAGDQSVVVSNDSADSVRPTPYMVIPIGTIGIDPDEMQVATTAAGVQEALTVARRRGVRHIVFWIDSPGGYVQEAKMIADVLRASEDQFDYYAVVRASISAAMWITLSCDRVFTVEAGMQGGALSYMSSRSGVPEYDSKHNSIIAEQLSSLAMRKGHDTTVVRAMVVPEAEVFIWSDTDGSVVVGERVPNGMHEGVEVLDSESTLLTLSSSDALRIGFAEAIVRDPGDLGELLEIEKWEQLGRYGERALINTAEALLATEKKRRDLVSKMDGYYRQAMNAVGSIPRAIEVAQEKDPNLYTYAFDRETGRFTPESARQWTDRTDEAIRAWNRVGELLATVRRLESSIRTASKNANRLKVYWVFESAAEGGRQYMEEITADLRSHSSRLDGWRDQARAEVSSVQNARKRRGL